jgi:hypothetical protein
MSRRSKVFGTLLITGVGCGCAERDRTQLFETVTSPGGEYALNAYVIEPWFPHGPHQVALDLKNLNTATEVRLLAAELAYDGVPFTKKNIGLRWTGDHSAVVCLSATDRPDKAVQISVDNSGTGRVEMRTGC